MTTIALIYGSYTLGGVSRVLVDTALRLQALGVSVILFAQEWDKSYYTLPEGIELIPLPDKQDLFSIGNTDFISEQVRQRNVKLFIAAQPNIDGITRIREKTGCKLANWLHINPIISTIYNEHFFRKELFSRSVIGRIKWLLWGRRKFGIDSPSLISRHEEDLRRQIVDMDYFFTLCKEYNEEISQRLGLSESQGRKVIPLINTLTPEVREEKSRKKEIIYMGRFDESSKQISLLPKLWSMVEGELSDWSFKIYGGGEDEAMLRELIAQEKLDRIELCGSTTDPYSVYQQSEILVMTSRYEGWGMVLAEAQAYGCIPMAFDIAAGVRTIIGAGDKAGILIPPFDLKRYARELIALCRDEARREKLRSSCYEKIQDYRPDINDATWMEVLREVEDYTLEVSL